MRKPNLQLFAIFMIVSGLAAGCGGTVGDAELSEAALSSNEPVDAPTPRLSCERTAKPCAAKKRLQRSYVSLVAFTDPGTRTTAGNGPAPSGRISLPPMRTSPLGYVTGSTWSGMRVARCPFRRSQGVPRILK